MHIATKLKIQTNKSCNCKHQPIIQPLKQIKQLRQLIIASNLIIYVIFTNIILEMDILLNIKNASDNSQQQPDPNAKTQQKLASAQQKQLNSSNSFKSLISNILDGTIDQTNRKNDVQLIRTKNNLLLILLVLSAYGVYYLIGDFLDVLLLAYIAGIAYNQSKLMFTDFVTNPKSYQGHSQPLAKRLIKVTIWLIVGFIFPRIRYLLTNPHKFKNFPTFGQYISSIQKSDRYIIMVCQILIGLRIVYLLLGKLLAKIGKKIRPTNVDCVRVFFAILTIIVILALVILIPTVLFKQLNNVGILIQKKVEQKLGCEIIAFKDSDNLTLPLCSQKLASENSFIQETVTQFQQQNQTVEECLVFFEKINQDYLDPYIEQYEFLRKNVYRYQQIACTWYSFIEKAVAYSGINFKPDQQSLNTVFLTGTNLFKLLFGNLAWILSLLSNSIFNLTTFITTFLLTCKYHSQSNTIKQLFSLNKQQLITSITNLIQATLMIVFEHFMLSYLLLQIFEITPINLIVSTMLASMAMFPFFRPWIGVLFVTAIRVLVVQEYYVSIAFVGIYYFFSQKIYSVHYRKMELHEIVTNMSVLFGIYRFGFAGVFYGPLIIITYQCVQRELFKRST